NSTVDLRRPCANGAMIISSTTAPPQQRTNQPMELLTQSGCRPVNWKRTTRARCSVSLRSLAAFHVPRQLVESLITEFDGAEADPRVALSLRWIQLPQSDDCLAIALFIERDGGAKYARIVIFVGAMIELDQVRPLDAPELHTIRVSLAVGRCHIETPFAADAN